MSLKSRVVAALLLTAPAFFLAVMALPHFQSGLAHDAALPVPNYLLLNLPLAKPVYANAERALAGVDRRDGEDLLVQAEAALYSGAPPGAQVSVLKQAIVDAPATARSWTLLSAIEANDRPREAADTLGQAFVLAPYDFWVSGFRAQLAAKIWDDLNSETRIKAIEQVRQLWREPDLRHWLVPLVASPRGRNIIQIAFRGDVMTLRDLNLWVMKRRHLSALK